MNADTNRMNHSRSAGIREALDCLTDETMRWAVAEWDMEDELDYDIEADASDMSRRAVETFTRGQCHALACALSLELGTAIIVSRVRAHMAVLVTDEAGCLWVLDIEGLHDLDDWAETWAPCREEDGDPMAAAISAWQQDSADAASSMIYISADIDQVLELATREGYGDIDPDIAATYARLLVRKLMVKSWGRLVAA